MGRIKLAIVGCGAVTKISHLPAIVSSEDVELAALVDKSLPRARQMAEACSNAPAILDDYRRIFDKADAAIVALPNSLHAPVTIDLLQHGLHVLVEKPMALNSRDCDAMMEAAARNQRVLAVGLGRRFCHLSRFVKQVLQQKLLGNIKAFDVREGQVFNWQAASDALFRKETAGGGVLVDIGVHVLDVLLWWFGDFEVTSYRDDSEGGLESNCEIEVRLPGDVGGTVELSRTRNLRNTMVIEGEHGALTAEAGFGSNVQLTLTGQVGALSGKVNSPEASGDAFQMAFRDQLKDFVSAIRNGAQPFVPGSEGKRAVQVIESCYAQRQPLAGWDRAETKPARTMVSRPFNLSGKHVLVTGGTGFIGGRLIERLVGECKAHVRILVRDFSRTARIGRFPVEMVAGNITDATDVERAAEGCEVIFHCAWQHTGTEEQQRRVIVEGTRNVLEAAAKHRAGRVVHMSTLMVYGIPKDGDLDESAPRRPIGFVYSDSKIEAEKLAFEYCGRGVPVCVLQPTTVYGPESTWYTVAALEDLKSGGIILVEGGVGSCNAVYVDDVVNAMLLGATSNAAVGEAFLISAEHPTTWREFYHQYEVMLGKNSTVSMPAQEALQYHAEQQKGRRLLPEAIAILRDDYSIRERIFGAREMRFCIDAARLILPQAVFEAGKRRVSGSDTSSKAGQLSVSSNGKRPAPLDPPMIRFLAAKPAVRIDKAKKMLGYEPQFDLGEGMKATERWARWANLIP